MEAGGRNVAGPITLVPFPFSDMRYALCNVSNDRRPVFDNLS